MNDPSHHMYSPWCAARAHSTPTRQLRDACGSARGVFGGRCWHNDQVCVHVCIVHVDDWTIGGGCGKKKNGFLVWESMDCGSWGAAALQLLSWVLIMTLCIDVIRTAIIVRVALGRQC